MVDPEILKFTTYVLESPINAEKWLHRPNRALNNKTPAEVAETDHGLVIDVLNRILYGIYS